MAEQLYVVWVLMDDGWYPGDPQYINLADQEADSWIRNGHDVRIYPRHSVTMADVTE